MLLLLLLLQRRRKGHAAAAAVVSNRGTAYSSYYSELLKTKVHASYAPARCAEGHPVSPWLKQGEDGCEEGEGEEEGEVERVNLNPEGTPRDCGCFFSLLQKRRE